MILRTSRLRENNSKVTLNKYINFGYKLHLEEYSFKALITFGDDGVLCMVYIHILCISCLYVYHQIIVLDVIIQFLYDFTNWHALYITMYVLYI